LGQPQSILEFLRKLYADGKNQAKSLLERTRKGHRRFDLTKTPSTSEKLCSKKHTLGYAPVSSHDQKEDLIRQAQVLENFCTANGWTYEILQDLGSGLNFQKKGLKKLIQNICSEKAVKLRKILNLLT